MTNIYFCDVCNESVPQADLDLGRALVVKGRVICSICDRAMTQRAEARAHTRPANFGLDLDASGGAPGAPGATALAGNAGVTAATLTETAPGAAPHPAAHPHLHHAHREPRGAGVGLAFATGIVALGGLAVLWQWTRDELANRDAQSARAAQMSVVEQDTARRGLERLAGDLERRVQAADERVTTALDAVRASGDAARSEQHAALEAVRAQIGALDQRVAEFGEQVAIVARHEQELMALQQRFSALGAELTALSGAVTRLGESANLARANAAPAPPAADERPAWFELTHLLESPSTADRWQGLIALGETRDIACAPYVAPLLGDKDIFIRMAAARVLGDLAAPAGVEPLIEALADTESAVREASLDALKRITKRSFDFDPQGPESERAKRVKQWREWWAKEREKFGA
jgi:hypothetical protein